MKHLITILLCMTLLLRYSNLIYGQDTIGTRLTLRIGLKLNPISCLVGAISGLTEIHISRKSSIQFGMQYWSGFVPIVMLHSFTRINGISVSFRHYNNSNIRRSGYIEPFVRYNNLWEVNQIGTVNIYSVGILLGKQWVSKNNHSFELFAGPYYSKPFASGFDPQQDDRIVISKTINEVGKNPYNGIWLRAGVTIGTYF